MYIPLIVIICSLTLIAFQDMKYRQIHIVLPVLLFIASLYSVTNKFKDALGLKNTAFNMGLMAIIFFILVFYMTIKNKRLLNPFENYFGLGDLLFYMAISPFFQLHTYILFFIISMIFSIILHLVFRKFVSHDSIPLAGFSALLLIVIIGKDFILNCNSLTLLK